MFGGKKRERGEGREGRQGKGREGGVKGAAWFPASMETNYVCTEAGCNDTIRRKKKAAITKRKPRERRMVMAMFFFFLASVYIVGAWYVMARILPPPCPLRTSQPARATQLNLTLPCPLSRLFPTNDCGKRVDRPPHGFDSMAAAGNREYEAIITLIMSIHHGQLIDTCSRVGMHIRSSRFNVYKYMHGYLYLPIYSVGACPDDPRLRQLNNILQSTHRQTRTGHDYIAMYTAHRDSAISVPRPFRLMLCYAMPCRYTPA